MGGATGMGLGRGAQHPAPVVVLDGDGAALMKLGTFATIGAYAPAEPDPHPARQRRPRQHGRTGDRVAAVDFAGVALACGYPLRGGLRTLDGFETAFRDAAGAAAPA